MKKPVTRLFLNLFSVESGVTQCLLAKKDIVRCIVEQVHSAAVWKLDEREARQKSRIPVRSRYEAPSPGVKVPAFGREKQ